MKIINVLSVLILLSACGKKAAPSIIGRWKAIETAARYYQTNGLTSTLVSTQIYEPDNLTFKEFTADSIINIWYAQGHFNSRYIVEGNLLGLYSLLNVNNAHEWINPAYQIDTIKQLTDTRMTLVWRHEEKDQHSTVPTVYTIHTETYRRQ